jgi:hypothetical protein
MNSESAIYEKQHFGKRMGFGRSAALLIVDFTVGFSEDGSDADVMTRAKAIAELDRMKDAA